MADFELLPEDLRTHLSAWRQACEIAREHAPARDPETGADDASYWQHQLNTLDRIEAQIAERDAAQARMKTVAWISQGNLDFLRDHPERFVDAAATAAPISTKAVALVRRDEALALLSKIVSSAPGHLSHLADEDPDDGAFAAWWQDIGDELTHYEIGERDLMGCAYQAGLHRAGVSPAQGPAPEFLCSGSRFKLSFNGTGHTASFANHASELHGRWVALVPAEDGMHLRTAQTQDDQSVGRTGTEITRRQYADVLAAGCPNIDEAVFSRHIALHFNHPAGRDPEAEPLIFQYTNHRGVTATRKVHPLHRYIGTTEFYPEPQWLLRAYDLDRDAERVFALAKMRMPA